MAFGVGAVVLTILLSLGGFFFLMLLIDSISMNRHRKKYNKDDDPSRKGGEFKKSFERGNGKVKDGSSNNEGERDAKRPSILPSDKVESGTEKDSIDGGTNSKHKKIRIFRRED